MDGMDPALMRKCLRLAQSIACHSIYPYCGAENTQLTHTHTSTEICEKYRNNGFCSDIQGYSDGNRTVYVDRDTSKWGPLGLDTVEQYLEALVVRLTREAINDTWTPGCDHSVRQLLCHATLPFCKNQGERKKEGGSERARKGEKRMYGGRER